MIVTAFHLFRRVSYFTRIKPQLFTLTQSANQRIRQLMQSKRDPDVIGVKIGIKKRGCNGLSYTMNYAKEGDKQKFDQIVLSNGIKVIVDNKALMALVGTQMDFVDNQLKSQFVFNNPNAKGTCGCGQSFHI